MRVPRFRLIVLLVLSSVSLLAQRQSDLPQFRAGVELVQLDVAVLDDKRQPVRGLTAADFTVLDNGVATPIRAFTPVELAPRTRSTEAVWAEEVPPDVVTNQVGEQDGRLVIILMDRSIPVQQPTVVARKIAAAAVEALGPHDLAAVISTSNGVRSTYRISPPIASACCAPSTRRIRARASARKPNRLGRSWASWTRSATAVACAGCACSRRSRASPTPCRARRGGAKSSSSSAAT